jgi:hydroxymethylbilane synthase
LRELGCEVEMILITTTGDVTQQPFSAGGEQGLFTKEIQRALLENRIDLAVHSLKDLPTASVPGLTLCAVPPRESPRDVLVCRVSGGIESLPFGARIGTGSRRRQSQLLHFRNDLAVQDIRGNVDTRLRKLDAGEFDAIVLAEAGLNRLGLADRATEIIPVSIMLPAVGQGALGIETRLEDSSARSIVSRLDDEAARGAVLAERALLAGLRGGCLAPVGAWARLDGSHLRISAVVLSVDGRRRVSVTLSGSPAQPEALGREAARELVALGADKLIEASRA